MTVWLRCDEQLDGVQDACSLISISSGEPCSISSPLSIPAMRSGRESEDLVEANDVPVEILGEHRQPVAVVPLHDAGIGEVRRTCASAGTSPTRT